MKINEIECKSALTKSGITDFCLNPYLGCQHGCKYCYAVFMQKWHHPQDLWGEFVDVKINMPEVLERELLKIKSGTVMIGSVTDAYQPIESRYKMTRQCLEKFVEARFAGQISILTKSALILRDLDLLKKLKNIEVGLTITTLEPKISQLFEPQTSLPKARLEALKRLKKEEIRTYAFVGPILPYFSDSKEILDKIFRAVKDIGVGYVFVDKLNYVEGKAGRRVLPVYQKFGQKALDILRQSTSQKYTDELKSKIESILKKINLEAKILF